MEEIMGKDKNESTEFIEIIPTTEEPLKVVAIIEMSAGNETIGEMWKEAGIFDMNTPLEKIFDWAYLRTHSCLPYDKKLMKTLSTNVILTIAKNTDI